MTKKANPVPKDWHPADVVAALRKAGWSLRRLGVAHGYSPCSLKNVLVMRWPKAERIVADALGVKPEEIWPSRYQEKPSVTEVFRSLGSASQFSAVIVTDKAHMTNSRTSV